MLGSYRRVIPLPPLPGREAGIRVGVGKYFIGGLMSGTVTS
jgi:hypothetical protein